MAKFGRKRGGVILAFSTCVKCGGSFFEIVEKEPIKSNYKLIFVQCSTCGGVVGVLDYLNIGHRTQILEEQIEKISDKLDTGLTLLNDNLNVINRNIKKIADSRKVLKVLSVSPSPPTTTSPCRFRPRH